MNPAICLLFLPSMVLRAQSQQSILLRPYFQKFSTFYSIGAPELPEAAISSNLTVTAADGAVWSGTPQGLFRRKSGETEFFKARRYLPDDTTTRLTPDPAGGMRRSTTSGG